MRFGLSLPLFRGLLCYAVHFFSHSYLSMITLTINSNGSKKYSPLSNSINQSHIHTTHSTYFKKASYKTGFASCTYLETWTHKQAHLYSCVRLWIYWWCRIEPTLQQPLPQIWCRIESHCLQWLAGTKRQRSTAISTSFFLWNLYSFGTS